MNGLARAIVNEGRDYADCCETARDPSARRRFIKWSNRVAEEYEQARTFEDHEPYSVAQMAQAVVELDTYYQEHIEEL